MSARSSGISQQGLVAQLECLKLDWGDQDDCESLVSMLCKVFTPQEAFTYLFFHSSALGTSPVHAVEEGRGREVFTATRALVDEHRMVAAAA